MAAATAAGVAVAQDFCSGTSIETYGDDLPSYDFISGQMALKLETFYRQKSCMCYVMIYYITHNVILRNT